MKKMLAITAFFFPALLFAQQKSRDFIKEHLYIKVSPMLMAVADKTERLEYANNLAPAILGAVGFKMRYAAVGYSTGYIGWDNGKRVTPKGIDLTITDFKQKVFPVITAQWHQARFQESYYYGRNTTHVTGKDLYSIGAGGIFRAFKTVKIMVTAGVSKWDCNVMLVSGARGSYQPAAHYYYNRERYKMVFLAANLVW